MIISINIRSFRPALPTGPLGAIRVATNPLLCCGILSAGASAVQLRKTVSSIFFAYEGQRTRENAQVTRAVPSTLLRQGIIEYQCAPILDSKGNVIQTAAQVCPGGTKQIQGVDATGLNPVTYTVNIPSAMNALGTPQIASMDPNCSGNGTCPWGPESIQTS